MESFSYLYLFKSKLRIKIIALLALVVCLSCNKSNEDEYEELKNYLNNDLNHPITTDDDLYIVFNQQSCTSCIESTKRILDNNTPTKNKDIHLVIAGFSEKSIKLFLGELIEKFDIIYDSKRELNHQNFFMHNNFYVYRFKDNNLVDHFYYNVNENIDRFERMMIIYNQNKK